MLIVLILILLLLVGIVTTDVITTVLGGAVAVGILVIVFIVRSYNKEKNVQQAEPVDPQVLRADGTLYCDDCKYCYGNNQAGNCLLGHLNPRTGVFSPICDDDFLPRDAPLPERDKER